MITRKNIILRGIFRIQDELKANSNVSGLWSVWRAQLLWVLLITGQLAPTCKANASLSLTKPLPASLWCIYCVTCCALQEVYVLQPRSLSPKQPISVCSVSQPSVVSVTAVFLCCCFCVTLLPASCCWNHQPFAVSICIVLCVRLVWCAQVPNVRRELNALLLYKSYSLIIWL